MNAARRPGCQCAWKGTGTFVRSALRAACGGKGACLRLLNRNTLDNWRLEFSKVAL